MDTSELHRIDEVPLREVWEHEEQDFTPWLLENVDQLASLIGIEIDDVNRETAVGNYTADLVGTEPTTSDPVVIENQFGPTDHDHLGKLLTYAAGIDAGFVVWVAEGFRDEHRSVLDWLNTRDSTGARFFGVRPRIVSVGADDATLGFEFTVVVEPNDWERELRDPLSDREQGYRDFFAALVEAYADHRPSWNRLTPQPRSYLTFGAGISGISFGWVFHGETEFSVELYIDAGDAEQNETIFETLKEDRATIESNLETDVVWEPLPDGRACRIKVPRSTLAPVEELTPQEQNELIDWGTTQMDAFRDVIEPRLTQL